MNWRRINAALCIASVALLIFVTGLWIWAWLAGFIGSTAFIGHVSMLALVLAAGSQAAAYLAAWRADVPDDEE